jgi:glucokinase
VKMDTIIAGVDIGGTHITAALIDVKRKVILSDSLKRMAVDSKGSSENIFDAWSTVIKACFHSYNLEPSKIGIAMPGPFDYKKGIALMKNQDKFDDLYGINIKDKMAGLLQINAGDISIANDAACFLQGEIFHGAAGNNDRVMGLTLGTGLGAAKAFHLTAEDADLWWSPFKDGIAEDYLSSRWFVKRFFEYSGRKLQNVKELVQMHDREGYVQAIFKEFGNNLATFIQPFMIAESRNVLILGGSISNAFDLFIGELQKKLTLENIQLNVRRSVLGESAAMVGAASFCQQEHMSLQPAFVPNIFR